MDENEKNDLKEALAKRQEYEQRIRRLAEMHGQHLYEQVILPWLIGMIEQPDANLTLTLMSRNGRVVSFKSSAQVDLRTEQQVVTEDGDKTKDR